MTNSAASAPTAASANLRFVFSRTRAVIDFLEELVVLSHLRVVRVEFERLLVRLARLFELALVLVGNREIVERGGVGRVDFTRFFQAVVRLEPKAALAPVDYDLSLCFPFASLVVDR